MYKKLALFAVVLISSWVSAQARHEDSLRIEELERIIAECKDPLKIPPGVFKEIKTLRGVKPRPDFKTLRGIKDQGLVHVFVDSVIYHQIQPNFDQFILDLQADGYSVSVTKSWNQTPEAIRATLQSEYASSGLVGAIFVGDVPAAWMETSLLTSYYVSHFPTDYFYMDLDGLWNDYDTDGFYDNLSGNLEPEIWCGRISPSACLFGDEVTFLNRYFVKNHAYRTGALSLPDRALGYLECPWYPQIQNYLNWVYSNVTFVIDENTTTALHYKSMLQEGYEWVHLLAHSSPWGSTFFLQNETYGGGSVFSHEMPHVNPQAIFVLLNACSNAKYTETNNLGQSYLFGSDYVLAVIGETRIMYGIDFEELYDALGSGDILGEAFLDWIWWYYEWFWGCGIFGDPTLKPHGHGNPLTLAGFSPPRTKKGDKGRNTFPVNVSPFTDGNPSACVNQSGKIWIAWNAGRDVRSNIWTSHCDGLSWSAPEEVAFSVPWDFHPSTTRDNSGNVWIFWQSYREVDNYIDGWDIYGIHNNGVSWSSPIRITTADPYDVEPKTAVDSSGNVWVVWRTERKPDSDIMYSYYDGYSWTSAAYVVSTLHEERDPVITVDKFGNVWVAWYARVDGNWDVYTSYYNGSTWIGPVQVTSDPGYDVQPSVAADTSGSVWLVWRTNRNGNLDIYSRYRSQAGQWSSEMQITTDSGDDLCPSLTYDGQENLLVMWQTNQDGDWNIYQSVYEEEWSPPVPVSTDAGNQIQPAAFCDGNQRFGSVFPGDQGENWDIYYSYAMGQWFAPAVNYGVGDRPNSVSCADLDGDGDLDLAVANANSQSVSILKNNGDGTFQTKVDYDAGDGPFSIFCADLDGDGDLDLAVANENSDNVSILKNDGDGTFQTKVDYGAGDYPTSVFCADLDGDGDLDLAVANMESFDVSILKNNGDGTFQTAVNYDAGAHPVSVFCADLDGDLDLDLAVANFYYVSISILKNNGDGTFQTKTQYVAGSVPTSLFCADLDGDLDLDLAVARDGSDSISTLMNNGDATFQTAVRCDAGDNPFSIFCADLDGDGDLDLAVANLDSDSVSILTNNGHGTFQRVANCEAVDAPRSVFCADLDGDGDLDLAAANSHTDSVSIIKNLSQIPANRPPYPFSLFSPTNSDSVSTPITLNWQTPYDPNFGDQIRYSLYASTVPDFDPDSTTTYDSLGISQLTAALNVGTYYWKVKAYDNWGAERWSNETWHFVCFIRGDANGDDIITASDVIYLINYLYRSGNPPVPLQAGDANGDGAVGPGDVVYLINYLFRNGEPPCS